MTPSDLILLSACGWRLRKFDPLEERDGPNGIWIMECSYCIRQVLMKSLDVTTTRNTSITESSWQEEAKETETSSGVYPTHNLFPTDELREPMLFGRPDNAGIMGWGLHEWASPVEPTPLPRRGVKRARSVPDTTDHVAGGPAAEREFVPPSIPSDTSRKRPRDTIEEEEASSEVPEHSPSKKLKWNADFIEQDDEMISSRPKRPRSREGDNSEDPTPSPKKHRTVSPLKEPQVVSPHQVKKRHRSEDNNSGLMDAEEAIESSNASRSKRFRRASTFHPLEEHTYSCPYVLKKRGEAGWTHVVRALPTDPLYYGFSP